MSKTPHSARKAPEQAMRMNDLITVRECVSLINKALAAHYRDHHPAPWYRRLWSRLRG